MSLQQKQRYEGTYCISCVSIIAHLMISQYANHIGMRVDTGFAENSPVFLLSIYHIEFTCLQMSLISDIVSPIHLIPFNILSVIGEVASVEWERYSWIVFVSTQHILSSW